MKDIFIVYLVVILGGMVVGGATGNATLFQTFLFALVSIFMGMAGGYELRKDRE